MDISIYAIVGRIKNHIAMKNIDISHNGTILANTYALALKDLYDFAETLPDEYGNQLRIILTEKEKLPAYVIELTMPPTLVYKEEGESDDSWNMLWRNSE